MPTIDPELIHRLRALIGRPCIHQGQVCQVLDLLTDDGILVVEFAGTPAGIQLDQFGQASHRGPTVGEIPILGLDGSGPSDDLVALLEGLDAP
jgi:hypothetical protein